MKFEEDYIDRKLVGSLAEQLFELLHFEIGCRVFRTGHEFLYPDLFNLANLKKRLHHKAVLEKDIEYFSILEKKGGLDINKNKIISQERFQKRKAGTTLAKSPDFTIITPSGNILQFEVKYRYDGELTEEEKMKYLKSEVKPELFVLMGVEPYIKVLIPIVNVGIEEHTKAFLMFSELLYKQYKKNYPDMTKEELDQEFSEHPPFEKIDELISEHFRDSYVYVELKREKDGSLRKQVTGLMTDDLIYSKEMLEKYGEIVKKWFNKG